MLQQGVENIWIFARFWSCWENPSKSLRAAEKNKEKVEANCTDFSAEFFGSHSVEMFCFARKTKIQMLTTSAGAWYLLGSLFLNDYNFITKSWLQKQILIFYTNFVGSWKIYYKNDTQKLFHPIL